MRIFNQKRTRELNLADLDLDKGSLVSTKMRVTDANGNVGTEHILVYRRTNPDPKVVEVRWLKDMLRNSDYQAIKFAEGELSAEEYAETKAKRKAWRERINELEALIKEEEV